MHLPHLPNEVLNTIFSYLSGPDLSVLRSTGSRLLETKILKQRCVTDFIMYGQTDMAQILFKKTRVQLRLPQMLFNLPFLTTFVMTSPKARRIWKNFNLGKGTLEKLPPTVTHLELFGNIDLVIDDQLGTLLDLGAKFPSLRTLKLERMNGETYLSRTISLSAFFEMLPPTLECLGLTIPFATDKFGELVFPSNLTSLYFFSYSPNIVLSQFAHLNLTHLSVSSVSSQSTFQQLDQLGSLELSTLEPALLSTFPSSLTNLAIQNMPSISSWGSVHHKWDLHWSRAIRMLPKNLLFLSLGSLVLPHFTLHHFDDQYGSLEKRTREEIAHYQKEIWPSNLKSLKLEFRGYDDHPYGDPCFILDIIPPSITLFHMRTVDKPGIALPTFKSIPPHLTSLQLYCPIPFQEDVWQHFQTLRYFDVANDRSGIPEAALFASDFPKNLTHIKIVRLTLDGTSWQRISKKSHFPRNQAFIQSHLRANKSAYIDALKFETSQMHCNIEIVRYCLGTVLVLPPASTSVNWRQIHLSSLVVSHSGLQDFPKGLTTLNLKQLVVSRDFITNLPSTLKTVVGGFIKLSAKEANDIASTYFPQWESIEIPGSFSRALQLECPRLKNIGVLFQKLPNDDLVNKWIHTSMKSLRLKNLNVHNAFTLLGGPSKFSALRKLTVHVYVSLSDDKVFDQTPNLLVMTCCLSKNSLAHLPKTLTDLTIVRVQDPVRTANWPPNLTSLKIIEFSNFLNLIPPNSMPILKSLDLGPNVRVDGTLVLSIPRSVTWLRIRSFPKYTPAFADNLPPNLQFIKLAFGGTHASDIHQRILERRSGFEFLGK